MPPKLILDPSASLEGHQYRPRPAQDTVTARQMEYDFQLGAEPTTIEGKAGDWLVRDAKGKHEVLADAQFKAAYQRVVARSKKPAAAAKLGDAIEAAK